MNPEKSTHEDEDREKLLKPRTHKRVLIMCQRKVSNLPYDKSVAKAVLDIDTYIKTHFGEDAKIEYLTYNDKESHEAYADHMFELSQHNVYGLNFMTHHNESYDIIILNTCPIKYLDFDMIYKILREDGILIVKFFGNKQSSPKRLIPQKLLDEFTSIITSKSLFIKQEDSVFGNLTFKKAPVPSLGVGKKLKKVYTRLKSRRRLKETRRRKRRAIK